MQNIAPKSGRFFQTIGVPVIAICQGLLFDLDGTLINSLPAVDRAWTRFSQRHGLDPDLVLNTIHGRRSIDSIRRLLPNVDAEAEDRVIRGYESIDTEGVQVLPGAISLLASLPTSRWAIVTSGTSDVAKARLLATGIPPAGAYVFGEDVQHGKPSPDPFLEGARRLGFRPEDCLGIEDTAAGVASIQASGARAIGLKVASADFQIGSLTDLRVRAIENGLEVSTVDL